VRADLRGTTQSTISAILALLLLKPLGLVLRMMDPAARNECRHRLLDGAPLVCERTLEKEFPEDSLAPHSEL
jgi:hypothetical protein